ETPEAELVAFEDLDVDIGDVVVALDVLRIDVGVDVTARAISVAERIDAVLNPLAANDFALLQREVSDDLIFREDSVAGDFDLSERVHRSLFHGNGDLYARFLAGLDSRDLRLAKRDVG